jgi:hypothetical protein
LEKLSQHSSKPWTLSTGLNPSDALLDADHDRYNNLLEHVLGGNITDASTHGTHPWGLTSAPSDLPP